MQTPQVQSTAAENRASNSYWFFVVLYVTFQLVSDVTAGKVIQLGPAVVSVTVLYFPVTYIIADVLTEVYGFARARRALWLVMLASVTAGLVYQLVVWLPPGPGFDGNEAYARVFQQVPRILLFGWIAVFTGDYLNNLVMSRLKVLMAGRHLWVRTISSTVVGEGVNTTIFYVGALYGVLPNNVLLSAIIWGWAIKVLVEVVLTPVTYRVVAIVKRADQMDVYDYDVSYSPLKF